MYIRTFRLFVSSTFSDFTQERKMLQTVVFPKIKDYCRENNLTFQPIDLRWGVTDEANYDQKTLELCLEEVQISKAHPYPNFLIMLGDKHGTVILPYLVRQEEFEKLLSQVKTVDDRKILECWYKLDKNQLPASYKIRRRKQATNSHDGVDYTNSENWEPIYQNLLDILQRAALKSPLELGERQKYFASATESEISEGVFKYLNQTPYQKKVIDVDSSALQRDYENVYAFIRHIRSVDNPLFQNHFVDKESKAVKIVQKEVLTSIRNENIYEVDINLTDIGINTLNRLTYSYKALNSGNENFSSRMSEFLKKSINEFLKNTPNLSSAEIEKLEQERFKDENIREFIGRDKPLKAINAYLGLGENDEFTQYQRSAQALVIYGKSGIGKTALIAKAVDNLITTTNNRRVVYRFVGSTSTMDNSISLLISVLNELGIREKLSENNDVLDKSERLANIDDFYLRVADHFNQIKNDTIIFIDAIDQLANDDEFLWLPKTLPSNLKIVISALEDADYEDTKFFNTLKNNTTNLYELGDFEDPKALIRNSLQRFNRTLSNEQINYFSQQQDSKSPLYITIASEELKHWSHNENKSLASTQKAIIDQYVKNLHKRYLHEQELVKTVFGYLYVTNGLSESELLEVINIDSLLVEAIAPDKYHQKETPELPIVIWARLHSHIKKFLKLEIKDNQETMRFFHREFNYSISKQQNLEQTHRSLIQSLMKLMIKYQNDLFKSNRWGALYVEAIIDFHEQYKDSTACFFEDSLEAYEQLKVDSNCISTLNNSAYKLAAYQYCINRAQLNDKTGRAQFYFIVNYFISKTLDEELHIDSLESVAKYYDGEINNIGISLSKEALKRRKSIYKNNKESIYKYVESLMINGNLSAVEEKFIRYREATDVLTEYWNQTNFDCLNDEERLCKTYVKCVLDAATDYLNKYPQLEFAILNGLIEEVESLLQIIHSNIQNENLAFELCFRFYSTLSRLHLQKADSEKANVRFPALESALFSTNYAKNILESLYSENERKWVVDMSLIHDRLALIHKKKRAYRKALQHSELSLLIIENQYEQFPRYYAEHHIIILTNNLSILLVSESAERAINVAIKIKKLCEEHEDQRPYNCYAFCIEVIRKHRQAH
jgi:hypothetical protein